MMKNIQDKNSLLYKIFKSLLFGLSFLICVLLTGFVVVITIYFWRRWDIHLDYFASSLIALLIGISTMYVFNFWWYLLLEPQGGEKVYFNQLHKLIPLVLFLFSLDEFEKHIVFRLICLVGVLYTSTLPLMILYYELTRPKQWNYQHIFLILFSVFGLAACLAPIFIWVRSGLILQDLQFVKNLY